MQLKPMTTRRASAQEAAALIQPGMTVVFSGYTSSGYPKAIPQALVQRHKNGENLDLNVITGSALGQVDELLADAISRRIPLQESKTYAKQANTGNTHYVEQQLCRMVRLLKSGKLGHIDVAVIEVSEIYEDGSVSLGPCIGLAPLFVQLADHIILERNTAIPAALTKTHDIFVPGSAPDRVPIPFTKVNERVGSPYVQIPPDKIRYIVDCDIPPVSTPIPIPSVDILRTTNNLMAFLHKEYPIGGDKKIPPIQTGFGQLAVAIADALRNSDYRDLELFSGAIHEPHMEMLAEGTVKAATATSIQFTARTCELFDTIPDLSQKLVLRNLDVINEAETVCRFGILALNSCIEADIYGNVNSSHIGGTRVVNGIGGGANFAQNAGLSVMLIPSTTKNGNISTIVPMVSHVDITEHDIDVIITDQGYADLRGLDERERAEVVIENCAHPTYRPLLWEYLERATTVYGGHHPQDMAEAAKWHERLRTNGSMLPVSELT